MELTLSMSGSDILLSNMSTGHFNQCNNTNFLRIKSIEFNYRGVRRKFWLIFCSMWWMLYKDAVINWKRQSSNGYREEKYSI